MNPIQLKGTEAHKTFSRSRKAIDCRWEPAEKGMAMTRPKGENELIRRLGMAVKQKWGAIPPFAQDQILDQVCEGEDGLTGVDIRKVLTAFLERDVRR